MVLFLSLLFCSLASHIDDFLPDATFSHYFMFHPPALWLAHLAGIVTLFGDRPVVTTVVVPFFLLTAVRFKFLFWGGAALTLLSILASLVLDLLKFYFQRPRPPAAELYFGKILNDSFPSGHAFIAVCVYGFLTYLLAVQVFPKQKSLVFTLGSVFVLAIGFSRVILGVHYFSDVLGGFLSGLILLLPTIFIYEYLNDRVSRKNSAQETL